MSEKIQGTCLNLNELVCKENKFSSKNFNDEKHISMRRENFKFNNESQIEPKIEENGRVI